MKLILKDSIASGVGARLSLCVSTAARARCDCIRAARTPPRARLPLAIPLRPPSQLATARGREGSSVLLPSAIRPHPRPRRAGPRRRRLCMRYAFARLKRLRGATNERALGDHAWTVHDMSEEILRRTTKYVPSFRALRGPGGRQGWGVGPA